MTNRIAWHALAGAALVALGVPHAAFARGGYGAGAGYRGAPTSTHFGTTNNGTHYAYGPNGAAAARDGHAASFNANTGETRNAYANDGRVVTNTSNAYNHNAYTNVRVDNNWNGADYAAHPYGYAPVAAAAATAAVVTAAAIGSSVYALPPACSPYGAGYFYCNGAYYQPRYEGTSVVYVVVGRP
jgi:hypothetical protein